MGALFGIILHAIGGFAAASFYTPFKKVKFWAWETYWLVGGVASWIIMPWLIAWLTVPSLGSLLSSVPTDTLLWTYGFGVLWGIGGLTFGLSMRYLGLSLGYAIALGFCAAFGTLIPPIFAGSFLQLLSIPSGLIVIMGVVICLIGIGICGKAGVRKENELPEADKKETIAEFDLKKGIGVAIFAGILSACMAFGLAAGKPIAEAAMLSGTDPLWQNSAVLVVVLAGGFTTNFLWSFALNIKNNTIKDYRKGSKTLLVNNYIFSSLAGIIWYFQFMFYGMGASKMGKFDFASWTLHMAFIIVFSNLWGFYFREWKGVSTGTKRTIYLGILIIISSTILIGMGTYFS